MLVLGHSMMCCEFSTSMFPEPSVRSDSFVLCFRGNIEPIVLTSAVLTMAILRSEGLFFIFFALIGSSSKTHIHFESVRRSTFVLGLMANLVCRPLA